MVAILGDGRRQCLWLLPVAASRRGRCMPSSSTMAMCANTCSTSRAQFPTARLVRDVKLGSKTEGCVVDDRTGQLYVAEEKRGICAHERRARQQGAAGDDRGDRWGASEARTSKGSPSCREAPSGGILIASQPERQRGYSAFDLESGRFVRYFRVAGSGGVDGASPTPTGSNSLRAIFGAPFERWPLHRPGR